ncbi:hypothetical protein [Paenibacillus donghaensis]|uniref:Uncharacterized protein n=1 Tax=Paenibacillus donghaensis TaxID=414771 RepID=A0A2Z2KSH5_9BACL|nr:hypothetical protein [Paenibacillus donghaensis]ASA22108.1 hypothetical protein B9T62_15770 [Paenibacillus donghaensis]
MSMNVHLAKKGHKVRFANRGGWDGEWERAAAVLKEKEIYIINQVDIYQSSTVVYLKGFGDRGFNSVFFELVGVPDYWEIEDLTNDAFAEFVKEKIEGSLRWYTLEQFFITVDDADAEDDRNEWTIIVDAKFSHALLTFYFSKGSGKWNYDILGDDVVRRYETISKGLRPEPPGVYLYDTD